MDILSATWKMGENPMLGKYLNVNICGHFAEWSEHYFRRVKPMDNLLIWVLGGGGCVCCEGKRINAKVGDLICLKPRLPHDYAADPDDPWDILWVHFEGKLARSFMDPIRAHGGLCVPLGLDAEIRDRWIDMVIAFAADQPGHEILVNTAAYALLGSIVHRLSTRRDQASEPSFDAHAIQSYIHHYLTETITLDDLARQFDLSPTHFVRVFKNHFGVSPIHYIIQRRVALACDLLAETSLTVKQISEKVGYDDPYYFSRLFKKVVRSNPTEYRRTKTRPRKGDRSAPNRLKDW